MSLIDRVFMRFDEFKWAQIKRRAMLQHGTQRTAIQYKNPETAKKRPVPLFGSDPNEGFALDWANRVPKTRFEGGPVDSKPEWENAQGFAMDAQPLIEPTEEYQDPAISHIHTRTSESTDQRPVGGAHDMSPVDKPITLQVQAKKSFESSRPKGTTIADQITKEMKNEPYWFGP